MVEYRTEYLKMSHVNLCSLPSVDIFDNVQTTNTYLNYLWRHLITMNISKVISGWREKINIRQSSIKENFSNV